MNVIRFQNVNNFKEYLESSVKTIKDPQLKERIKSTDTVAVQILNMIECFVLNYVAISWKWRPCHILTSLKCIEEGMTLLQKESVETHYEGVSEIIKAFRTQYLPSDPIKKFHLDFLCSVTAAIATNPKEENTHYSNLLKALRDLDFEVLKKAVAAGEISLDAIRIDRLAKKIGNAHNECILAEADVLVRRLLKLNIKVDLIEFAKWKQFCDVPILLMQLLIFAGAKTLDHPESEPLNEALTDVQYRYYIAFSRAIALREATLKKMCAEQALADPNTIFSNPELRYKLVQRCLAELDGVEWEDFVLYKGTKAFAKFVKGDHILELSDLTNDPQPHQLKRAQEEFAIAVERREHVIASCIEAETKLIMASLANTNVLPIALNIIADYCTLSREDILKDKVHVGWLVRHVADQGDNLITKLRRLWSFIDRLHAGYKQNRGMGIPTRETLTFSLIVGANENPDKHKECLISYAHVENPLVRNRAENEILAKINSSEQEPVFNSLHGPLKILKEYLNW